MDQIRILCAKLDEIVARKAWPEALKCGVKLWKSSHNVEIKDREFLRIYIDSLFKVADLVRFTGRDPFRATAILKRAYSLDDFEQNDLSKPTMREVAAHRLGEIYEQAKCHQSAAMWFRRSLEFARNSGVKENILFNLYRLGWNLETLKEHQEACDCYDEILEMLSSIGKNKLQEHLHFILPAAIYHIHHGIYVMLLLHHRVVSWKVPVTKLIP